MVTNAPKTGLTKAKPVVELNVTMPKLCLSEMNGKKMLVDETVLSQQYQFANVKLVAVRQLFRSRAQPLTSHHQSGVRSRTRPST